MFTSVDTASAVSEGLQHGALLPSVLGVGKGGVRGEGGGKGGVHSLFLQLVHLQPLHLHLSEQVQEPPKWAHEGLK